VRVLPRPLGLRSGLGRASSSGQPKPVISKNIL
jgi:hypothetical protein